jgi:EmrB/QacA subfamily drug resistance transporter
VGHVRYAFFALAAFAVLMSSIDSTIVAVALPQLTSALDAPLTWVGWTLTAYQLVQVIMLPLSGKLSDTLGRKRVFLFCVGMFTLGSLLCGLAPSISFLIVFRAIQAIGGGGLMPSAVGIVSDQFRERRSQAIGLFTSVFPIGGIIGPNLGGYILEHWSWREMFFVNVPIGVVVFIAVFVLLPGHQAARPKLHADPLGLLLYSGAIVALMYGMTAAADDPSLWRNPLLWGLFVVSVVLGFLFVRHIRRAENPVMDYRLVATHPFLAANLYNFFFGAAAFGFFSFVPYYAVTQFGMGPLESGAVLTPRAIAMIAVSGLSSITLIRYGYRLPMLAGMVLVVVTLLLLAQQWTSVQLGSISLSGFWYLALVLAISGAGMGLANPASNNAALDLAPGQAAALTGVRGMFRLTGGVLSIAGIVLALTFFPDQAEGLAKIFLVLSAVLLVTVPLALMIPDTAHARYVRERAEEEQSRAGPRLVPPAHRESPDKRGTRVA